MQQRQQLKLKVNCLKLFFQFVLVFLIFNSFNYKPPEVLEYIYKKRKGPQRPFRAVVNEGHDLLFADQHVLNLAWLLSRRSPSASHIASWTGYHIQLRNRVPVTKNFVGYLDCLDAPATEMSIV